ncbi:ROK family protein [Hwangdonia lutea]|uniref:ROK family protein n=1 Tax=Hwangdonia lutea TaxID=3075823 RepID=A0AA97EKL6_9FLAO|nr:ROK family protein [Hwangdonia sp. SCSIO 19198]WOD43149.1 ROK family protein [Hwangdonia sp. SCSIO 19198]
MKIANKGVIGIDIGGTKISGAIFTFQGEIVERQKVLIDNAQGKEAGLLIDSLLGSLLITANSKKIEVKAIGACVPGISDKLNGTVWAPNIKGWENYPLYSELTKIVDNPQINITIESDRSCYILGETWKGATKGCDNAIFIAVGTGIGAGILMNGQVLNGSRGISGAIGWLGFEPPYKEKYDNCGNFEYYASGNGLVRSAKELLEQPKYSTSLLSQIPKSQLRSEDIFEAFKNGDALAKEVFNKAIVYWGIAVANMVSVFNPEKIVFGGGVFGPAEQFLNRIIEEAKKWAQPLSIKQVQIEISTLKGSSGLIGAAYSALKSIT